LILRLQIILEGEALGADVSVDAIASATDGFSGSDLRQLCATAAMCPVRELLAASGKSAAAGAAATAATAGADGSPDQAASGAAAVAAGDKAEADTESGSSSAAAAPGPGSIAAASGSSNKTHDDSGVSSAPVGADNANGTSAVSSSSGKAASADVALADGSTPADGERALLGQLLAECEAVAAEAASSHPAALRPVSAADFVDAQKDVAPSVAPDSATMAELRAWNAQYGEGGSRDAWNPKLSYFM
jgi:SpoVK/Ycf46/Vps4 family AAA+-type ATPase